MEIGTSSHHSGSVVENVQEVGIISTILAANRIYS